MEPQGGRVKPSVKPGSFSDTVHSLIDLLGRDPAQEGPAEAEQAGEFLLCFKRFDSPKSLWHLCRKACKQGKPIIVRGTLRLLRLWLLAYGSRDFPRLKHSRRAVSASKSEKKSSRPKDRFLELLRLVEQMPKRHPDLNFDNNRLKLVIISRELRSTALPEIIRQPKGSTPSQYPRFYSFSVQEVAQQMTLLEHHMFQQISTEEFYSKTFRPSSDINSPKSLLAHMIMRSDQVSSWVASHMLSQTFQTHRARAAQRFILIAEWCERLGNFNALMEILGGFNLWCISRLRKSWQMSEKYGLIFARLQRLMSPANNYATYRAALAQRLAAHEPTMPYIGLFMKDLTFIEDGNADMLDGSKINLQKVAMIGGILRNIRAFQRTTYSKVVGGKITPLLQMLAALPRMTDEQLNRASEAVRPRNAESTTDSSSISTDDLHSAVDTAGGGSSGDGSDISEMVEPSFEVSTQEPLQTEFVI